MQAAERRHEVKFLLVTLLLVLGLAAAAFINLMRVPAQKSGPATTRNPTSVKTDSDFSAPSKGVPNFDPNVGFVHWDCRKSTVDSPVGAAYIRIKGASCRGGAMRNFHVVNSSNGFTASVFWSDKNFTTDLIDLQPGPNRISMDWIDARGRVQTSELSILRAEEKLAK
ncbi:MAG: hypothetical protein C5B49_15615 [Bdellovibrio sp.]|nr:MAG: hypothetical protein C5B49_15615 [Bdellovibrio sp.]